MKLSDLKLNTGATLALLYMLICTIIIFSVPVQYREIASGLYMLSIFFIILVGKIQEYFKRETSIKASPEMELMRDRLNMIFDERNKNGENSWLTIEELTEIYNKKYNS